MTIHKVKSWTHLFQATDEGLKTSDIRYINERDYKVGDYMILQETDIGGQNYTGNELVVLITHIISKENSCALSNEVLMPEACILSIKLVGYKMPDKWYSNILEEGEQELLYEVAEV